MLKWTLIDIAVPADQNVIRTEEDKVEKYQELVAFEIRRTRGASKVTVIPIVTGALGSMSKIAKTWYEISEASIIGLSSTFLGA